jgi:signal transduction histidine kinase
LLNNRGEIQQVIFHIEDISLRLQYEQQIQAALDEEQRLSILKSRFVSLISHELRTPLAIISTSTEIIARKFTELTPIQLETRTRKILAQIQRLKRIMEDVSFINKLDIAGHEINLTVVNLKLFTEMVIDEMLLTLSDVPSIALEMKGIRDEIVMDETLLHQMLANLISNAIKYTPVDGQVYVSCDVTEETITLEVRDNGMGIPEKDQRGLFNSFHRASNVSDISGTGLGLVIVRRAVDILEGSIDFSSREGEGTTFTICLPSLSQKLSEG